MRYITALTEEVIRITLQCITPNSDHSYYTIDDPS